MAIPIMLIILLKSINFRKSVRSADLQNGLWLNENIKLRNIIRANMLNRIVENFFTEEKRLCFVKIVEPK